MLDVQNLKVSIEEVNILSGINLKVNPGEVHAIMGPNGSGKSTLAKTIAGHPDYQIISGTMKYIQNDWEVELNNMEPDIRAKEGIFLGFQYPTELPGVSNLNFLWETATDIAIHQGKKPLGKKNFMEVAKEKLSELNIDENFLNRSVNCGFSGGEKKKNEILQMMILDPKLVILDETDSGLDIDALKIVADGVNRFKGPDKGMILVTHYQRLLEYIKPDFVHVLVNGEIVKSGDYNLAIKLEDQGYDWLLS